MRKKLSDVAPYITAYSADAVTAQLEPYREYEIDIGGCRLLDGANAVINSLINRGFILVDSENKFNNNILSYNRQIKVPDLTHSLYPDKYASTLKELSDMMKNLDEDKIYNCRNPDDFPLVFITQLFKPQIVWHIPEEFFTAFAEYAWKILYYKHAAPNIMQFVKIMENERKMDMLAYNNLYSFYKPKDFSLDNKCVLPNTAVSCTWGEAFYLFKILPFSLCREKHIPKDKEDPYYQVLKNIADSIKPKQAAKIDLKEFIGGGYI